MGSACPKLKHFERRRTLYKAVVEIAIEASLGCGEELNPAPRAAYVGGARRGGWRLGLSFAHLCCKLSAAAQQHSNRTDKRNQLLAQIRNMQIGNKAIRTHCYPHQTPPNAPPSSYFSCSKLPNDQWLVKRSRAIRTRVPDI